jgi:hypothetical protein
MLARSLTAVACLALVGCDQGDSAGEASTPLMRKPTDFGIETYRRIVATLEPQIDFGPDGESQDEPWTDTPKFRKWLEKLELGELNTEALLEIVPSVSLALNHGPLLGVESFMEDNSESGHKVWAAGFLIFATGPNGDFIVVDVRDGSGRTGWLPMAMIWGMDATQVRDHFVPTNKNLGEFLGASEQEWADVPKDWYDARDEAAKTN